MTKPKIVKVTMTESEYHDHTNHFNGVCCYCGEIQWGEVEPDARRYECGSCGLKGVYGVEEAFMSGFVVIKEEEEA